MTTKLKERPDFNRFKSFLREAVAEITGLNARDSDSWASLGDESIRKEILFSLKRRLEEEYGVELVLREGLAGENIPVESVAIQLHHVYNTVYLMERINEKIKKRK